MAQDWQKLIVPQLKEELQNRGLSTAGKKAELIQRLVDADASAAEPSAKTADSGAQSSQAPAGQAVATPATATAEKPAMTEADRVALRKQRFGDAVLTEEERRKQREQRFNMTDPIKDEDRQKLRAQRFGIETEEIKQQKLNDRAKRFSTHDPVLDEDKKKARLERFKQPIAGAGQPASVDELQALIKKRT